MSNDFPVSIVDVRHFSEEMVNPSLRFRSLNTWSELSVASTAKHPSWRFDDFVRIERNLKAKAQEWEEELDEASEERSDQKSRMTMYFTFAGVAGFLTILAAASRESACFAVIAFIVAVILCIRGVVSHHSLAPLTQRIEVAKSKRSKFLDRLDKVESELNQHLAAVKLK